MRFCVFKTSLVQFFNHFISIVNCHLLSYIISVFIATELLTARKDLARDMALITPYVDSIPSAFIAQVSDSGGRFGGTISAIGDISYELLPEVNYANVQMIGYRFTMTNVKILENTA